ncbi:R-spondin-4 [Oryctolagus cuniculus]|uniref:R-spondin-4 n=1 Tax=Oryctolagus cuniculus TaxID=9986 RepID=UPI0007EE6B61
MRTALPEQLPRSCRAVGSPVELQGSRPTQVAQMRAPLCWLLLVAHAVDMLAQTLRKKQVDTGLGGNCTGCIACSEVNGCSSCQHRLFLFISREGMRQYGKCLHDCPPGFFGVRGQDLNQCRKCRNTCERCFSRDFCIRCKKNFYLHKGKCLSTCPPGTLTQQSSRECKEECEHGSWGSWSRCTHKGKTCGSAWGLKSRVREAGRDGRAAPSCKVLSEWKKCSMQTSCPPGRSHRPKNGRKRMRLRLARK